jgi:hypothetical protein
MKIGKSKKEKPMAYLSDSEKESNGKEKIKEFFAGAVPVLRMVFEFVLILVGKKKA